MASKLRTHRALLRVSVVAAVVAAAFTGVGAPPAAADPPTQGGGTVTEIARIPTDIKFSGRPGCENSGACAVVMITGIAIDGFSGTLNGVAFMEFHATINPLGVAHVRVDGSCECVVEGKLGTVLLSLNIHDRTAVGGGITGVLLARGVSGDLEGFHGNFEIDGFTYSGSYHFADH